jgi:hypothetical protein
MAAHFHYGKLDMNLSSSEQLQNDPFGLAQDQRGAEKSGITIEMGRD